MAFCNSAVYTTRESRAVQSRKARLIKNGSIWNLFRWSYRFVALSYARARLSYRLRVRPSVCHTLVL